MSSVIPGRFAAKMEEPFAVFIIGMRINKLWAVHKWLPVAKAMPRMLKELTADPELGMLHVEPIRYRRGFATIQYWKSFDHLEHYATKVATHTDAWRDFNRAIGEDGSVGIWHETYAVQPNAFEAVYGNMPRFGLAAAGDHVKADGAYNKARGRMSV